MDATIRTKIIDIGDQKGICLDPAILERLGVKDEVVLQWNDANQLVIGAKRHPREGWEEQLKKYANQPDDPLFDDIPPSLSEWDETEWKWE